MSIRDVARSAVTSEYSILNAGFLGDPRNRHNSFTQSVQAALFYGGLIAVSIGVFQLIDGALLRKR